MLTFKKLALITSIGLIFQANAWAEQINATPKITQATPEFVYKYLLGEIAGQRGELSLASQLFYDLAKQTRDPRLAERAAHAAAYARQPALALQASTLWTELDPNSVEAQQAATQLLIASGNLSQAKPQLQKLLAQEDKRANGFMSINNLLANYKNKQEVLELIKELAKPYPKMPESHFSVAQAAYFANNIPLANSELEQADKIQPGWEPAAQMRGQMLFKESPEKGLAFYQTFLTKYPKANDVRMTYAKSLVAEKRYSEAKPEFSKLVESSNGNPDVAAITGFLSFESSDYPLAIQYFQQALKNGYKDPDQLNLYMGHALARQEDARGALTWYDKIQAGPHFLDGRLSAASLIAKTKSPDAAIAMLDEVNDLTEDQQILVIQTQASLLNQASRSEEAFRILENALATFGGSPELRYDFAMTAERLKKLNVMEDQLYQLIRIKPDFAAAYNALGYSYADRNIKLDEAKTLIETALKLSPGDHYILDSLGWVYYRMGDFLSAIEYLKQAYEAHADPEIAAHLGEVLWVQGRQEEAKKIWEQALKDFPENAVLLATANKFKS